MKYLIVISANKMFNINISGMTQCPINSLTHFVYATIDTIDVEYLHYFRIYEKISEKESVRSKKINISIYTKFGSWSCFSELQTYSYLSVS